MFDCFKEERFNYAYMLLCKPSNPGQWAWTNSAGFNLWHIVAISSGDIPEVLLNKIIKILVSLEIPINHQDSEGRTPLSIAAQIAPPNEDLRSENFIKKCLALSADPLVESTERETALQFACSSGIWANIMALWRISGDFNRKDIHKGRTLLHWYMEYLPKLPDGLSRSLSEQEKSIHLNNSTEILDSVKFLLGEPTVDLDILDSNGETILHILLETWPRIRNEVLQKGLEALMVEFLDRTSQIDAQNLTTGKSLLHLAIDNRHFNFLTVKILQSKTSNLKLQCSLHQNLFSIWTKAVFETRRQTSLTEEDLAILNLLLKNGADPYQEIIPMDSIPYDAVKKKYQTELLDPETTAALKISPFSQ